MAGKAVAAVRGMLERVGIKAPWKITGVASTAEFQDYLPIAGTFRAHAPASSPIRAVVPHAQPEHVYDIRYSIRDTRREHMLVGGTNQKSIVKSTLDVGSASPMLVDGVPPTPGVRHRWGGKKALLDYDNNGTYADMSALPCMPEMIEYAGTHDAGQLAFERHSGYEGQRRTMAASQHL